MSDKVKVAAIQIQYPDGEMKQVSIDDARELYRQLEQLFGSKTVVVPSAPVIIERDRWPRWQPLWVGTEQITTGMPDMPRLPQVWCCAESA